MRPTSDSILELLKRYDTVIEYVDQAKEVLDTLAQLKEENLNLERQYSNYPEPIEDLEDYAKHLKEQEAIDQRRAEIRIIHAQLTEELKSVLFELETVIPYGMLFQHPVENYSFRITSKGVLDIVYPEN